MPPEPESLPATPEEWVAQWRSLQPDDAEGRGRVGVALRDLGQHDLAVAAFTEAAALQPGDPAPLIHAASCHMARDAHAEAFDAVRQAFIRAPRAVSVKLLEAMVPLMQDSPAAIAERWVQIGLMHYRHGDIGWSKNAFRQALQLVPDHGAAAGHLGVVTRLGGDAPASERMLRAFIERVPASIEPRLALAEALQREERFGDALVILNAPASDDPVLRQRQLLQACAALNGLRKPAEAGIAIARLHALPGGIAPEWQPLLQWRELLATMATLSPEVARERALAIQPFDQVVLDSPLETEQRIMLHYDLAKFWLDRGDIARNFNHWQRGHAMIGQMQPFTRETVSGFYDALIAQFDHTRLQDGARASNTDEAPVFVVGMPRSGTTLMEQILDAHPQVYGAGERNAIGELFLRLGGARETAEAVRRVAALDGPQLDQAAPHVLAKLHALAPQATRIVDKMPGNFRYLGFVSTLLPRARIIHCVRDPRDIGLSIYTFRFHGHHPYAHDIADLGWYIGQHDQVAAHWRAVLPNPILTIALSDWVEDFTGTLRRVLDFLGLPYDEACERFYESDRKVHTVSKEQVKQPVNARGLDRWRKYAQQLRPLIRELQQVGSLPPDETSG